MEPFYQNKRVTIYNADCIECLKGMPEKSVHTCVTSPPYFGLRNYGVDNQVGLEETPEAYVEKLNAVFRELHRVLRDDGTLWLNLGDSYYTQPAGNKKPSGMQQNSVAGEIGALAQYGELKSKPLRIDGLKQKDLIGIPWRTAFALQADGWYLRQDIIWHKPNAMPESVKDRCTKAHEYIFLLSKSKKYYYDNEAIMEQTVAHSDSARDGANGIPGIEKTGVMKTNDHEKKNKRSVWSVCTRPYKGAHFATFPSSLITPCILAGCPVDGVVLDPFSGSGTTSLTAMELGRKSIGIELNEEYCRLRIDDFDRLSSRWYCS